MKWTRTFNQAAQAVTLTITGCANQQDVTGTNDEEGTSTAQSLDPRVIRGFGIAPVPLNLKGRNHTLVVLGSYLVNTTGACNNCHTNPSWADGHDPFQGQPKQVNTAGYLAGGKSFNYMTTTIGGPLPPARSQTLVQVRAGRRSGQGEGLALPRCMEISQHAAESAAQLVVSRQHLTHMLGTHQ